MTLITDVLKRAARQCSVDEPSDWLSATDTEHVELRDDFLLETVEDISERVDLPAPIGASTVITGDGSETYDLPSDFLRVQRDPMAVYETTRTRRALIPATNDSEWTHLKEIGATGAARFYRVTGYDGNFDISIYSLAGTGVSVTVHYITNKWMATSGGTAGNDFTDSGDVLLMPRRLVESGIVYRFRDRNGLPAASKRAEYEMLLQRYSQDSRGRKTVCFGEPYEQSRPWDVPIPDQIPTS